MNFVGIDCSWIQVLAWKICYAYFVSILYSIYLFIYYQFCQYMGSTKGKPVQGAPQLIIHTYTDANTAQVQTIH